MDGVVHEAYAFVCMGCGHGWERDYEIRHVTDLHGKPVCVYYCGDVAVASPFRSPQCERCSGVKLRVLPAGRVARMQPPPPVVKEPRPVKEAKERHGFLHRRKAA
jgi:hypothetical protein